MNSHGTYMGGLEVLIFWYLVILAWDWIDGWFKRRHGGDR